MAMTATEFPPSVFAGLDHTSPLPLYYQIAQRIEAVILDGAMPVESWIENEGALAARLRTSRATIRRALQELVGQGLVSRHQGKGTQVVSTRVLKPATITGLFDELQLAGRHPTTDVLRLEMMDRAAHIERLRYADGHPVAVLRNHLPDVGDVPSETQLYEHGLYELLRFRNSVIRTVRQSIGGRAATPEERRLLRLPANGFVLTVHKVATDPAGRVIDVGDHTYRADAHVFEVTLTGLSCAN